MSESLSKQETYLLQELETARKLTFHIDELRNKLSSFFMTFVGIAGVGLSILIKGEADAKFIFSSQENIAILFTIVAVFGAVIVLILGRLRRAQIEHFHIINNIRAYFLEQDVHLWNVVQLSAKTLPKPNHKSGTYFWTLLIMITSCGLLAFSLFTWGQDMARAWLLPALGFVLSFAALDCLYFWAANPPKTRKYSSSDLAALVPDQMKTDA